MQGVENAHPADLADAEISPSGLSVHFPKLDADLYLPALLEGFLGSRVRRRKRIVLPLSPEESGKNSDR